MKIYLTYFLIFLYLIISANFSTNIHFCGGKLKSITLVGYGNTKKCCKGKKMKKNCCKDFRYSFKSSFSDENKTTTASLPSTSFELVIPVEFNYNLNDVTTLDNLSTPNSYEHPPPEAFPLIYIKNCVFII